MATSYFPAGAFGKLPHLGDFFKHNAGTREMLAFDQWLQQGILHAKSQLKQEWDAAFDNAPAHHFLFYADNPERFLLGIFQPSQDKTVRKYPFWVSLQIERNSLGFELLPLAPVLFSSFFQQALSFLHDARNGLSMPEISARVEALKSGAQIEMRQQFYHTYLDGTTLESLLQGALGGLEDSRKYLLFKNLVDLLAPLRNQDLSRVNLGLRFPLGVHQQTRAFEVCFWFRLCKTLLGTPPLAPILFWSADSKEQKAFLYLYFRPPSAKNFLPLLRAEEQSDTLCKLEEEGLALLASAEGALSATSRALLQTSGMSLGSFLRDFK